MDREGLKKLSAEELNAHVAEKRAELVGAALTLDEMNDALLTAKLNFEGAAILLREALEEAKRRSAALTAGKALSGAPGASGGVLGTPVLPAWARPRAGKRGAIQGYSYDYAIADEVNTFSGPGELRGPGITLKLSDDPWRYLEAAVEELKELDWGPTEARIRSQVDLASLALVMPKQWDRPYLPSAAALAIPIYVDEEVPDNVLRFIGPKGERTDVIWRKP